MSCIKAALFILLVLVAMSHEAVAADLTDAGGPFERAFCLPPCPRVAAAHRFPGANAGDKIAAAIAALPANIGGYVDATGFANSQNVTGFTIPPGVTVQLGPILYTLVCGVPITVNNGGHLLGMGSGNPGNTRIKLSNSCNHAVIKAVSTEGEATGYWHSGEIRNIWIDGNKANNTAGNCVEVYRLAEASVLEQMIINNCEVDGLLLTASNSGTGSIRNITVNVNGACGIHIDDFKSALYMQGVGGDENPVTLCITNPNNGGGSIYIDDFKSEKSTVTGPAVTIGGGSSPITLTFAGGSVLSSGVSSTTFLEILNTVTANPIINIQGLITFNNQTTVIDDQENSFQVAGDAVGYHGLLHYHNGKYIRFDANGLVTYPRLVASKFSSINVTTGTLAAGNITGAAFVSLMSTNATPGNQTTRTATQMFADQVGAVAGDTYTLVVTNTGAGTLTLVAGSGVTLTGTMTVPVNTTRTFIATFTSSTALTIQSVSTGVYS